MNGITVICLCIAVFVDAQVLEMPEEIGQFLGLGRSQDYARGEDVKEEIKEETSTFPGSANSKYPVTQDTIETARKNLGLGSVAQYMPAPIQKVECHVEFQVTERVPGRCTKLAGTIPACQAEKYIGINYSECS